MEKKIRNYQGEITMTTNICRPFTLYNDFIPPVSEDHDDWRYLSFGYYDGFERGDNLFVEGTYNLQHMWKYYLQQSEKLNGSYLSQILCGLREEEVEGESITDKEFWDKETMEQEYPFVFLSLIQIDENKDNNRNFRDGWDRRSEFERGINTGNTCYKVIVYMSFDSSDLILVVRSKSYMTGAKFIDQFHGKEGRNILKTSFGWKLKYSFTVASFNKNAIDSKSFSADEKISRVVVYLIERCPGGIDDYIVHLRNWGKEKEVDKDKLEAFIESRHTILGCNDEVFEIKDISWRKLLELYREKEGIFNSTNGHYKACLNGITTIIGIKKQVESNEQEGT